MATCVFAVQSSLCAVVSPPRILEVPDGRLGAPLGRPDHPERIRQLVGAALDFLSTKVEQSTLVRAETE